MRILIILLLFLAAGRGQSFQKIFVTSLTDTLATDYTAAYLLSEKTVDITDGEEIKESGRYILRINNSKGKKYSYINFRESEFVDIESIEIDVYDSQGQKTRHLDRDDAEESALSPGYVLYDNNRYLSYRIEEARFPWYIDVRYVKKIKSHFFWPDWYPQSRIPVLSSSYTLINKKDIPYKTKTIGNIPSAQETTNGKKRLKWSLKRVEPLDSEDFMAPENKVQTALLFQPHTFEMENVSGNFESWNDVAAWYRGLASSQYNLTPEMKRHIRSLVSGIDDDKEKIRVLYRYLQENTRYVAIQLGIGGWKPYSAREVYENKYGDCKDLSTMMVSMLEAVGIPAYPALILTRDKGRLRPDFPSSQFNHCIAFVPLQSDTLWLECTSDVTRLGHIPYWLQDTYALVVREDRGELIYLPLNPAGKNELLTETRAVILSNGSIRFSTELIFSGDTRLSVIDRLKYYKDQEKISFYKRLISRTGSVNLASHSWSDSGATVRIKLRGTLVKVARKSGRRLFFQPSLFSTLSNYNLPDEDEQERDYPLFFDYAYSRSDHIEFTLPRGYKVEAGIGGMAIDTDFAQYQVDFSLSADVLDFKRLFIRKKARIPLEEYGAYRKFLKKAIKQDKMKLVLKK